MKLWEEDFSEPQIGGSSEALQRSLELQRDLFHSQVDQLQRIVVKQCKLTGVNPLSQEMAAGALSVKIGKRPRDLLNPKAVKYMQSVFSIKDAVSKKECREIGALFGVTVTQVREFFASQRTRVRKLVCLSREKASRSNACSGFQDGVPTSCDSVDPVPLNTINPTSVETPSCSMEDDVLPGISDLDKKFVESIFNLMRKEETFSGQVKLMEWILQIQNPAVLCWFLSKGGTVNLATWLSQAATEEQTSVLLVILQVLCHLPLNKALPLHMSAILQSVNRLRFYKISDISNRARVLLSKWSKSLAKSQALKKPNAAKSSIDEQQELILKQSLRDVIGDESWQSSIDTHENLLDASDDFRKSEPTQALKLLAASEDSNKKQILGVSSQNRERRKVQLVEQPGQKSAGRSPQAAKAAPLNQSRPMSADDIQKAKMRAQFMQSKYRKHSEFNENKKLKTEVPDKTSQVGILPPGPKVSVQPEEHKKLMTPPIKVANAPEASLDSQPRIELKESVWEKCRRVQISWKIPPEVELKHPWRVCAGENSKEVDVQRNRNRREKETIYQKIQDIPPNPKEPWDLEMDYDDTLTTVIPAEQLPEGEGMETHIAPNHGASNGVTPNQREHVGAVSTSQVGNLSSAEPDLELLAVLLKNPELVFALTSGQASNLSAADTVKLLDMIKAGGGGNSSCFTGINKQVEEKVEVSLPSPTPPSNPGTSGWRSEAVRNPFSQVHRAATNPPAVTAANKPASVLHVTPPQQPLAVISPPIHQYSPPQVTSMVHEKYTPLGPLHHKIPLTSSSTVQSNLYPTSKIKPAHISSATNSYNSEERFHISTLSTPSLPSARVQTHQQHSAQSYQPSPAYSKDVVKPSSDFWRARQGLPSNYNHQPSVNENGNYNNPASFGRPVPAPPPPRSPVGTQWEDNEYGEREDFESWSPNNSPSRSREFAMMGRNFPEPRMGYRPDQARLRNSSNSGNRDHNRYGNRRWRDRRR